MKEEETTSTLGERLSGEGARVYWTGDWVGGSFWIACNQARVSSWALCTSRAGTKCSAGLYGSLLGGSATVGDAEDPSSQR
jgi:hypothetical protein